jgi:Xaa-Pro aminopeptidase
MTKRARRKLSNRELFLKYGSPAMEAPFSLAEYRDRLERVRREMARRRIDLLYLSSPEAMSYLSGYQAIWYQAQSPKVWPPVGGVAVHADHDKFILFDSEEEVVKTRYATVSTDTRVFKAEEKGSAMDLIVRDLRKEGWLKGTVGLEMRSYRPNRVVSESFQKKLERAGCKVVDGTEIVRDLRAIKSPAELACVETAAHIADVGMNAATGVMRAGVTELDVYGELICAMSKAGGENPGITLPVVSGPKSGCMHGLASRRKIMPGDIVNIDICGVYNRYHYNMARTYSIGAPHPDVARVMDKSARSMALFRKLVKPGVKMKAVLDRMVRYYKEAGIYEDHLWIGGYDIGLAFPPDWVGAFVYDPSIDLGDATFRPGMVVNYESNFYLPEAAGVSLLIDSVIFRQDGACMPSRVPHDLIVIE